MTVRSWIADDLPEEPYDDWLDRGDTYQTGEDNPAQRPVKRQIGFSVPHRGVGARHGQTRPVGKVLRVRMATRTEGPMSTLRLAFEATQAGEIEKAWDLIRQASAEPGVDIYDYWSVLGNWYARQHDWETAAQHHKTALGIKPLFYQAQYNAAFPLFKLGKREEAAPYFEAALKLDPGCIYAWVWLAACCLQEEHYALALALYAYAAKFGPDVPEARAGYGIILGIFDRDDAAITEFRKAVELAPDEVQFQTGLGYHLLRAGEWTEGWKHRNAVLKFPPFGAPWDWKPPEFWRGPVEELRGKRVMIWSEQGHGDTIQFCRYIPLVQQYASEVVVRTEAGLVRLLETMDLGVTIIKRGDDEPEHDCRVTMMSVPETFETTPQNCPAPAMFHVRPRDTGTQIGVCWHGGERPYDPGANADDRRRSIPIGIFQPVIDAAGSALSLQEEDLKAWGVEDWYDTARLVAGLKLVITVDTAVAHLAASLGVETWLLARAGGCWRWLSRGDRTCWYPTMKLYRQPALGEWGPVIEQVVRDLKEWRNRNGK